MFVPRTKLLAAAVGMLCAAIVSCDDSTSLGPRLVFILPSLCGADTMAVVVDTSFYGAFIISGDESTAVPLPTGHHTVIAGFDSPRVVLFDRTLDLAGDALFPVDVPCRHVRIP